LDAVVAIVGAAAAVLRRDVVVAAELPAAVAATAQQRGAAAVVPPDAVRAPAPADAHCSHCPMTATMARSNVTNASCRRPSSHSSSRRIGPSCRHPFPPGVRMMLPVSPRVSPQRALASIDSSSFSLSTCVPMRALHRASLHASSRALPLGASAPPSSQIHDASWTVWSYGTICAWSP
jgi:hypothetical protein